jgi:hypothetical protein
MSNPPPQLVQRIWNYCSILRNDGLSYGDYVEHAHVSAVAKMADEQSCPPFNKPSQNVAEVERRLSVVEKLETVVSANLQRTTLLRQSILPKAFTGGLAL